MREEHSLSTISKRKNKLKILRDSDLISQISKSKKLLPYSISAYGWLTMRRTYNSKEGPDSIAYIPEDPESPFFIAITKITEAETQSLFVFWDMDLFTREDAEDLLLDVPDLNWKEEIFLSACAVSILDEIEKIIGSSKFSGGALKRCIYDRGYGMLRELVIENIRSIPGFTVKPLQKHHAEQVYAQWAYQNIDSLNFVERNILAFPAFGVFHKSSDNEPEKLVSWVISKNNGELGFTHTIPEFRNRSLASMVTLHLAKAHLDNGLLPYTLVSFQNASSRALHEKIGFDIRGCFGWEFYRTCIFVGS